MSVTIPPPHSGVAGKGVHQPFNWIQSADPTTTDSADVANGQFWLDTDVALLYERVAGAWVARMDGAGSGAVDSVNGLTGVVVLDPDDLDDSATTNKFATAAELSKLAGIEALADVTDATNVEAAGAVMVADASVAGYGFVLDEDAMTSDSATKVPTQQSVKAYVDAQVVSSGAVDSVNGLTGVVVLDPDDLDDTSTTNKFATASELSKLAGIEALADVTDAANVASAGAVMAADTSTAAMGFVIDEDSFASNLATKVPTQQAVKAYVDAAVLAGGGYTDEQAQDAVGTILTDSSSIDFTYTDGTPAMTASVILEWLQDTVAAMFTGGSHTGLTTTYQDAGGVVDLARSAISAKIGPSAAFDGGGAALTTVVASPVIRVPYATTIAGWTIQGNGSGSAVVDVQRATSGSPTSFSSIAGTAKPTLSSAQSATDTTISGWGDTTLDEGDLLKFVLSSVSGIAWLGVFLHGTRSL